MIILPILLMCQLNILTVKGIPVLHSPMSKLGLHRNGSKIFLVQSVAKSINNVVDITNFILHEYGQPLHAFDADKLDNKKIRVTKLPAGTEFQALDNRTFKLSENDLVICDGNGNPLCIAGVYGGKDSGVTDSTVKCFLESAHFDAESVRKTSMRHNLRTDAAKVFEKGSDPNVTVAAIKKAAILMVEYAGAIVSSELVDVYPEKFNPRDHFKISESKRLHRGQYFRR
ncbi:MAG: hypothetical protein IPL23_10820 [Saprospiraceae bacterium]|nr:hypothetical protein [Saprospiraceae bacterium]